jgi:hypothetical protein
VLAVYASHIGLVALLVAILLAALTYYLCSLVGLPQIVSAILAVLVALVALGIA